MKIPVLKCIRCLKGQALYNNLERIYECTQCGYILKTVEVKAQLYKRRK